MLKEEVMNKFHWRTDKPKLYLFKGSRHSKEAEDLCKKVGLETETFWIETREELGLIAMDFFYCGGPNKFPALYDGKWYAGLDEIKEYLKNKKSKMETAKLIPEIVDYIVLALVEKGIIEKSRIPCIDCYKYEPSRLVNEILLKVEKEIGDKWNIWDKNKYYSHPAFISNSEWEINEPYLKQSKEKLLEYPQIKKRIDDIIENEIKKRRQKRCVL